MCRHEDMIMYNDFIESANRRTKEMTTKQLQVSIKNVYGNELIYPACEQSELFCKLANTKTFTHHAMQLIEQLGYTFVAVLPQLKRA